MKALGRAVSLILVCMLMLAAVPDSLIGYALAEGNNFVSTSDIAAAVALTGAYEGAATWHEGMGLEASMNANQMTDYLDFTMESKLASLMETVQGIEVRLGRMKSENADRYAQLMGNSDFTARLNRLDVVRQLYSDLHYYRDNIADAANYIDIYRDAPFDDMYDPSRRAYYGIKLRDMAQSLRTVMNDAAARYAAWEEILSESPAMLSGLFNAVNASGNDVIRERALTAAEMNVSAPQTRLDRLTGNSLYSQTAHVMVVGKESFGVKVLDDAALPIADASVTITDYAHPERTQTLTTDAYGNVRFSVTDFSTYTLDYMELSIRVEKGGMTVQEVPYTLAKKGSIYGGFTLTSRSSKPVLTGVAFDEFDALVSDLYVYYSSYNDELHNLTLHVKSPDQGFTARVTYTDINGRPQEMTSQAGIASDKIQQLTFSDYFLRKIKPGGVVTVYLTGADGSISKYATKLKVLKSEVDKPSGETSRNVLESLRTELFSFTFPDDCPAFLAGSRVSLDINELVKYLPYKLHPHIAVAQDGTVSFGIGVPSEAFETDYKERTWKTENQKINDANIHNVENQFDKESRMAQAGGRWQNQKDMAGKLMGSVSLNFAFFAAGQFKPFKSEKGTVWHGKLSAGVSAIASLIGSTSLYIGYCSLKLEGALTVGYMIDFDMSMTNTGGKFRPTSLNPSLGGCTVTIEMRLKLTATLGIGLEGIASAGVSGYAYIDMFIDIGQSYILFNWAAGVYAFAQFLWDSWTFNIWTKPESVLYDSRAIDLRNGTALQANADAPIGIKVVQDDFDNLRIQANGTTVVVDDNANDDITIVTAGSYDYAFYIAKNSETDETRLNYICLTTGFRGDIAGWYDGQISASPYDYAYQVQSKPKTGKDGLVVTLFSSDRLISQSSMLPDGTVRDTKQPDPACCYVTTFVVHVNDDGSLYCKTDRQGGRSTYSFDREKLPSYLDKPRMCISRDADTRGTSILNFGITARDMNNNEEIYVIYHEHYEYKDDVYNIYSIPYLNRIRQPEGDYTRISSMLGYIDWNDNKAGSYYAIDEKDGIKQLVHGVSFTSDGESTYGKKGEFVLDEGDISSYELIIGTPREKPVTGDAYQSDQLFYLKADPDYYNRYRLHGATIVHNMHWSEKWLYRITKTDYDITLPVADLHVQQNDGLAIFYWVDSSTSSDVPGEATTPRDILRGMYYDVEKDIMSDMFTIADVTPDDPNLQISNIHFGKNGKCWGTLIQRGQQDPRDRRADAKLVQYQIDLMPQMSLNSFLMVDSLVRAGDYGQFIFNVENDGNVGLTKFKAKLRMLNGKYNSDPVQMQTLNVDLLYPEASTNVIDYGRQAGKTIQNGVYRTEGFRDPYNNSHWNIVRSVDMFADPDSHIPSESHSTCFAETNLLMQDDVNVYKASMYTAPEWDGDYDIELQVTECWATQDWNETLVERQPDRTTAIGEPVIYHYSLQNDGSVTMDIVGSDEPPQIVKHPIKFPSIRLNTAEEDIGVTHREYDVDGEPMVEMHITNRGSVAKGDMLPILHVYEEGNYDRELYRYTLPRNVLNDEVHTYIIPLSWLTGGKDPESIRIEVYRDESQETIKSNNGFDLQLRTPELTFVRQPHAANVLPGETAMFEVEVSGGVAPYRFIWQMREKDGQWQNIDGSDGNQLLITADSSMDGLQVRCIVEDSMQDSIASMSAYLHVMSLPQTGDTNNPMLWMLMCWLSIGALALLLRHKSKRHLL